MTTADQINALLDQSTKLEARERRLTCWLLWVLGGALVLLG